MLTPALFAASLLPLAPQSYRLSDPQATLPPGEVPDYALSPDGTRAVFVIDGGVVPAGLWSARLDGAGPPTLLTSGVPAGVEDPRITADGLRVVYRRREAERAFLESVPLAGGSAPVVLNPGAVAGAEVESFELTPSGARVVYQSNQQATGVHHLYSVPSDGSAAPQRLNLTLPLGDVLDFALSPDGAWVVYRGDLDFDSVNDLYSVPSDGSAAPVRLNLTRPYGDVNRFAIAWDSLGVVYTADQDTDGRQELYAVEIDGSSAPVKRSGALTGDVVDFELSAVDDRLVYRADLSPAQPFELFSTRAIAGGTPVKLSAPVSGAEAVSSARISADGQWVAYDLAVSRELFLVPVDGSAPASLVDPRVTSYRLAGDRLLYVGETGIGRSELQSVPLDLSQPAVALEARPLFGRRTAEILDVLADGSVLFTADDRDETVPDLYRARTDGSTSALRLSGPMVSGGGVLAARGSADASRVVYRARTEHAERAELFVVDATGAGRVRLSPELARGPTVGSVRSFQLAPGGEHAVYLAKEDSSATDELFVVRTDGSGHSVPLNRPFQPVNSFQGIADHQLSPDGNRVAYRLFEQAQATLPRRMDLFVTTLAARRASVRVNPDNAVFVHKYAFTADSTQLVFLVGSGDGGRGELWRVPSDGSQPATLLQEGLGLAGVTDFILSPDSAWAVYPLHLDGGFPLLFSAPLDGHQAPVQVSEDGTLGLPVVQADSSRVAFLSFVRQNLVLHIRALDGSGSVLTLSDPLTSLHDGRGLVRFSPDGTRIVFTANKAPYYQFELYSAPSDGSAPPTKLSGVLGPDSSVDSFQIDPNSTRVVYALDLDDQDLALQHELYSVPLNGGASPLRLNPPLPPLGNVNTAGDPSVLISSFGWVAFTADVVQDEVHELYRVPLDGSAPAVLVHAALLPDRDVLTPLTLSTDGREVLYVSDQHGDETFEVFAAPLDGSAPPRLVSGAMTTGGSVTYGTPLLATAGSLVLYRADQDTDGVVELHAGLLERSPRRSATPTRTVSR